MVKLFISSAQAVATTKYNEYSASGSDRHDAFDKLLDVLAEEGFSGERFEVVGDETARSCGIPMHGVIR